MMKVYAVRQGDEIRIGGFGVATNDSPVDVPESVAEELAGRDDLRCERPVEEPVAAASAKKVK